MYIFEKQKTVKIVSASVAPLPNPVCLRRMGNLLPDPLVVTLAYYYAFIRGFWR